MNQQGLLKDVSAGSGAVMLDRDGLPHFTGEEKWLDEFEERARGRGEVDPARCVVVGVQDAAFDNLRASGSQGGRRILLADPAILEQTGNSTALVPIQGLEHHSGRIKRTVRSTLAAEAYSMGESAESVEYVRFVLAELFDPEFTLECRDEAAEKIPGLLITDARSLYDSLCKDGSAVRDRRLRLEMNIIKDLRNVDVRWIRSEMMIADGLTKDVSEEIWDYAEEVLESGRWTLGVDSRAPPPRRGRELKAPDAGQEESDAVLLAAFRTGRRTRRAGRRHLGRATC